MLVGAIDTPRGTVLPATKASGPKPAMLIAVTLMLYLVPLVRPLIEQLVAVEGALQVNPPGVAVAT